MEKVLHILIHALKDTIVLLPFLLIVYFLIELLEYKNVFKFEKSKLLTGKISPIVGGLFGIIPQCGFSVVSAELYSEKKMSISALIAVFLATSDEAFPILISNYKSIPVLIALLISKFIIAISVGYLVMFITRTIYKNSDKKSSNTVSSHTSHKEHETTYSHHHEDNEEHHEHDEYRENHEHHDSDDHHENNENKKEKHSHIHACCHHDINNQQKFNWKHPIIHSLKITLYIFIVNAILGSFFEIVGEDNIANFLISSSIFQPLLALLIGFIPNCASSVIITELYMQGFISFGAIITGLCANAGIGLFVLFKNNKNLKENAFIVATIIITSLVFGYIFHFIPMDFLKIA